MTNREGPPQVNTGQVIDDLDEQLCDVRNGDTSPSALERLKALFLLLERLWVTNGEGKSEKWRDVAPSVNNDLKDAAGVLYNHGMIHEDIGK